MTTMTVKQAISPPTYSIPHQTPIKWDMCVMAPVHWVGIN